MLAKWKNSQRWTRLCCSELIFHFYNTYLCSHCAVALPHCMLGNVRSFKEFRPTEHVTFLRIFHHTAVVSIDPSVRKWRCTCTTGSAGGTVVIDILQSASSSRSRSESSRKAVILKSTQSSTSRDGLLGYRREISPTEWPFVLDFGPSLFLCKVCGSAKVHVVFQLTLIETLLLRPLLGR